MYEIVVRTRFAAAHCIKGHKGLCARLHGHTWQVEAGFKGKQLDRKGMLVDFNEIKNNLNMVIEELDHRNLNDIEPFRHGEEKNPTAENLARYIYLKLKPALTKPGYDVQISYVRVWESPDASAVYTEED